MKKANNDFEKNSHDLLNNSMFDKEMENFGRHSNI